jgi:hypothetical protein
MLSSEASFSSSTYISSYLLIAVALDLFKLPDSAGPPPLNLLKAALFESTDDLLLGT